MMRLFLNQGLLFLYFIFLFIKIGYSENDLFLVNRGYNLSIKGICSFNHRDNMTNISLVRYVISINLNDEHYSLNKVFIDFSHDPSRINYYIYKDPYYPEGFFIEILSSSPSINYTLYFVNLSYHDYPLFIHDIFHPLIKTITIEVGCLAKAYLAPSKNDTMFNKVLIEDEEIITRTIKLKSPSFYASFKYHLSSIISAVVVLIVLIFSSKYIFYYGYLLKRWLKLQKEISKVKTKIRNIEYDYFKRRITKDLFDQLLLDEQHRLYSLEAEALKLRRALFSWKFLKRYVQKKKR